nr:uORF5 [Gallus gallus]
MELGVLLCAIFLHT